MSGQFDRYCNATTYWTLTPHSSSNLRSINYISTSNSSNPTTIAGVSPSMNLKFNVIITGGNGTKNNPFTIALQ